MRRATIDGTTWFECPTCTKLVRMKKFFGTLHLCLSEEEIAERKASRLRAVERLPQWMGPVNPYLPPKEGEG